MLPGPLYAIDFKAGQNFEGQVEPFELAAGRAHPILSLTLADGRQVSLAHHPAIENPYPAGFPILPFYRAQQTPPRNCTCCGLPPPVPATRVADRDSALSPQTSVGRKVTVMTQDAPGPKLEPHLLLR